MKVGPQIRNLMKYGIIILLLGINAIACFRYYIRKLATDGSDYELISQSHDTIVALDFHYQ